MRNGRRGVLSIDRGLKLSQSVWRIDNPSFLDILSGSVIARMFVVCGLSLFFGVWNHAHTCIILSSVFCYKERRTICRFRSGHIVNVLEWDNFFINLDVGKTRLPIKV